MKPSLLIGIVLFVFGLVMAVVAMVGVDDWARYVSGGSAWNLATPVISGLSLAIGALLIGLSVGNWQHPRSHIEPGDEIVDPEGYHKVKHV